MKSLFFTIHCGATCLTRTQKDHKQNRTEKLVMFNHCCQQAVQLATSLSETQAQNDSLSVIVQEQQPQASRQHQSHTGAWYHGHLKQCLQPKQPIKKGQPLKSLAHHLLKNEQA